MMMTARCTYLTVHLVRYAMLVLTAKDSPCDSKLF